MYSCGKCIEMVRRGGFLEEYWEGFNFVYSFWRLFGGFVVLFDL